MESSGNVVEDNIPLLDAMMGDLQNQKGAYGLSAYWVNYSKRVCRELNRSSLKDFRSNSKILKGYGETLLHDPMDLVSGNNWKERVLSLILDLSVVKKYIRCPYISIIKQYSNEASYYKGLYYNNVFGAWFKEFLAKYKLPYTLGESPNDVVRLGETDIATNYLKMFLRVQNFQQR